MFYEKDKVMDAVVTAYGSRNNPIFKDPDFAKKAVNIYGPTFEYLNNFHDGTVAKSNIPAGDLEKIKDLFEDSNANILAFKSNITNNNINKEEQAVVVDEWKNFNFEFGAKALLPGEPKREEKK